MKEMVCCVCGKNNENTRLIQSIKYNGVYCQRHYSQLHNLGHLCEKTVFDRNEYYVKNNIAHIIIRNNRNENICETTIDVEDLERVLKHKWKIGTWGYISNYKLGFLQRFILNNYNKNEIIDHIDRNPLNNCKNNLRISNKSTNAFNCDIRSNNKSGVTGVCYIPKINLWRSYINYQGKRIELGYFKNKKDAIISRLNAENFYYPGLQVNVDSFKKYKIKIKRVINGK